MGLNMRKPACGGLRTTKAQTSLRLLHLLSLISTFVIRFLENIISKLATVEILIFQLVSVVEETGLRLAFSETLKTGFVVSRPLC